MSQASPPKLQVRAYVVPRVMGFLRYRIGVDGAMRVWQELSPSARQVITTSKPADWCSVRIYSELLDAVAAVGGGDDERARDVLIACGEFVAREATNTFLRLAMRLLTPQQFFEKLPAFWTRDFSGGRLALETTDQRLVCRLSEVTGLSHGACIGAGFVKFALSRMGKTTDTVNVHNWSLSMPCAGDAWFELTWKN